MGIVPFNSPPGLLRVRAPHGKGLDSWQEANHDAKVMRVNLYMASLMLNSVPENALEFESRSMVGPYHREHFAQLLLLGLV